MNDWNMAYHFGWNDGSYMNRGWNQRNGLEVCSISDRVKIRRFNITHLYKFELDTFKIDTINKY